MMIIKWQFVIVILVGICMYTMLSNRLNTNVTYNKHSTNANRVRELELQIQRLQNEQSKCSKQHQQIVHSNNDKYCVEWHQNSDEWWTHHPTWFIDEENNTHTCYMKGKSSKKNALLQQLYNIQWSRNCSNVITKTMWSSGYAADIDNIVDGLSYALESQVPFQIKPDDSNIWHYAGLKHDKTKIACGTTDMFCYFLPFAYCPPSAANTFGDNAFIAKRREKEYDDIFLYATRPRQWLRRRVQEFITNKRASPLMKRPCTVLHVRRADVVLHLNFSRRYHEIHEYFTAASRQNVTIHRNILLLTDDSSAIIEARRLHSSYNWMYIKRKRFHGSEGGWEKQIPSNNPAFEVTILQVIFRLARLCDSIIHSNSGFGRMIYREMLVNGNNKVKRVDIDKDNKDTLNPNNFKSDKQFYQHIKQQLKRTRHHRNITCAPRRGIILSLLLGHVGNNIFEICMANMLATKLCNWDVFYIPYWSSSFISDPRALKCFPNAFISHRNNENNIRMVFDELNMPRSIQHMLLNPDGHDVNTSMIDEWSLKQDRNIWACIHNEKCDFSAKMLNSITNDIMNNDTTIRIMYLRAFFIQHEWMLSDNNTLNHMKTWFQISSSCCKTRVNNNNNSNIFMDIRNVDVINSGYGVYMSILDHYKLHRLSSTIYILCESKHIRSKLVTNLKSKMNVVMLTSIDEYDEFCMLTQYANTLILSYSSLISQLSGVLNRNNADVHVPIHSLTTTGYPMLIVPSFRYHMSNNDTVEEFDIKHDRIRIVE